MSILITIYSLLTKYYCFFRPLLWQLGETIYFCFKSTIFSTGSLLYQMVRLLAWHLLPTNNILQIPHVFRLGATVVLQIRLLADRAAVVSGKYSFSSLLFNLSWRTAINVLLVVLALLSNWILLTVAAPLRLSIRFLYLLGSFLKAFLLVLVVDFKNILILIKFFIRSEFFNIIRSWPLLALVITIWTSKILIFYTEFSIATYGTYAPAGLFCSLVEVVSHYQKIIPDGVPAGGIMSSLVVWFTLIHFGSCYISASSAKRPIYGTYYLLMYLNSLIVWLFPEYLFYKIVYFYMGGWFFLFFIILRGLREDNFISTSIQIDPFSVKGNPFAFLTRRHHRVLYGFFERIHSPSLEALHLWLITCTFGLILLDSREIFMVFEGGFFSISYLTTFSTYLIVFYLISRQASYMYSTWLFVFSYTALWAIFGTVILMSTGFSYFGLISHNVLNETTAISSLGLVSSFSGLEALLVPGLHAQTLWHYGESLQSALLPLNVESRFDTLQFVMVPFKMGSDIYTPPHALTPHDDHNWTLNTTFENLYFSNVKLAVQKSDSLQADVLRYWPIERNLHIWFGEFLEKDLYYGWSHRALVDTESFFESSPYGLSNIVGDNFTSKFLIEVLNLFVGGRELDSTDEGTLDEWGHSYGPGASIREQWSFSTENKTSTLDSAQKSRTNTEQYHEWFPGIFVLDGRFDVKQPLVFLRFFFIFWIFFVPYSVWTTIQDRPSVGFFDTFGENDMGRYNFFFFGNGQTETLSTYHWGSIFNATYEWPVEWSIEDDNIIDPMSSIPSEELFGNLTPSNYDSTILDSFFHVPILKSVESYTAAEYKKYLMPLLFPMSGKSLWGSNVAREVNFEYPAIFETVYNNLMGFGDYYPRPSIEYDGTAFSGSDDSSTGDDNPTESNELLDDTVIDEPATETQAEWTSPDFFLEELYYPDYLEGRLDMDDENTPNLNELWLTNKIKEKLKTVGANLDRPFLFHGGFKYGKKKIRYRLWENLMGNSWEVADLVGKFPNKQTVEIHIMKPTLVTQTTDVGFQVGRNYPSTNLYGKNNILVNLGPQQANASFSRKSVHGVGLNPTPTSKDISQLLGHVSQKWKVGLNSNVFFYADLVEQAVSTTGLSTHETNIRELTNFNTYPQYFVRESETNRLEIWSKHLNKYLSRTRRGRKGGNIAAKIAYDNYMALVKKIMGPVIQVMLMAKYWKYSRWSLNVQKFFLLSKFGDRRSRKLFPLHYNEYRNWFKFWVQLYGKNFYPSPTYYIDTFIERCEKYHIMGLFFRFLMRFKTNYKIRTDTSYFSVYYFAYLYRLTRQNMLIRRVIPLHKTVSTQTIFQLYQKRITAGKYWSGPRLKDPKPVRTSARNALYVRWVSVVGKQKAPLRYNYAVSHLIHSVYSTTHSRFVKSTVNEVGVSDFLLGVLENHILLTKNRTLLIPKGSFVTNLIPKLPTLWFPKFLTIKEHGKLTIYLAEVPYRHKALMLLVPKQSGTLTIFVKADYLPSQISTSLAVDPRSPNPYTPFDPDLYLRIEHSRIYWIAPPKPTQREVENFSRDGPVVLNSKPNAVRRTVDYLRQKFFKVQDLAETSKHNIDAEETTTESSSSTEDTESSDETDSDETYAYNWEAFIEDRYAEMAAEEVDEINIFDYLEFVPLFAEGTWGGSDSEGTVIETSNNSLWTPPRKYQILSGIFLLNTHLYEGAIGAVSRDTKYLSVFEKHINVFVSDDETRFYDDRVVASRNLPLMWLEFTRHLFISRWRLQYDYSRSNKSSRSLSNASYPGAFFYEYYRFKYLIYSKFIKKETLAAISNMAGMRKNQPVKYQRMARRWSTLRPLLQRDLGKTMTTVANTSNLSNNSRTRTPISFKARNLEGYMKKHLIKSPYASIIGRLAYVRNKITSKVKSTSGIVAYKRPYRIPVELIDPKTEKDVMFDTRSAWYRFIYLTDYFDENEDGDAKVREYRQYGRSDASLRFKRNWFFSNYKLEDRELMLVRGGSWVEFSEFEADRKRSRFRGLKHGGQYRTNLNSELWWTKWDRPDHGFRRIDDLPEGILDSYGPANHLHGGLKNVVFPSEDPDIFETTLPIFEKSLLDPESPALNEDGEFAEFDENVQYSVEYGRGLVPDHLMPSDVENFNLWDEAMRVQSEYKKMKILGFGSSRLDTGVTSNRFDFNPMDFGDLVDVLSVKSVHPIAYHADQIFEDNIDQKLEEALLFHTLTGIKYDRMFFKHRRLFKKRLRMDWLDIDILGEFVEDYDENPIGLGYDFILSKFSSKYWKIILRADSNWEDMYASVYPQIHDSVDNMYEYLPVWNYDPAIWEYPGHDYDTTPLILNDDSKLLLNAKLLKFDSNYKWLASKHLVAQDPGMETNNWGGSHPVLGFNEHVEFDFLYDDEDVDTDVDVDVENLYLIPGGEVQNIFEDEEETEDVLDRESESDLLDYYKDTEEIEIDERDAEDIDQSSVGVYSVTHIEKLTFDSADDTDPKTMKYKFFEDHEWLDYADSDETTAGSGLVDEDSRAALSSEDEEDEFYFDTADPDAWDVSIHFLDGREFDQYSLIDWGQENGEVDGETDYSETAAAQNYASTEGVYQDFIENDYARAGREFPEEINFMLQDDQYDELISELEITDLPDSVEISELDSIDSEFSISQFEESVLNPTETSQLYTTIELTAESSSDFMTHTSDDNLALIDLFDGEQAAVGWRAVYINPIANPEIDVFAPPPLLGNRPKLEFEDYKNSDIYQAEKMGEMFRADWDDSSPIELEDTSRETHSFFKVQKYIDAYRLEALFDELVFLRYLARHHGIPWNTSKYVTPPVDRSLTSFKHTLFKRTNYLSHYRSMMVDLGLQAYMF